MPQEGSDTMEAVPKKKLPPVFGKVISADPVVTISKTGMNAPGGIAGCCPRAFEGRKSVHLLGLAWTAERAGGAEKIAKRVARLQRDLPDSHFVILANSEFEAYKMSLMGLPTVLANELIFVDERSFHPRSIDPGLPMYDAVYNGRVAPYKRTLLASQVESLLLVYAPLIKGEEPFFEKARQELSSAVFYNHQKGGGRYVWLDHDEICEVVNQARVGLCLSAEEGAMRASIEYALCGLPIISTPSRGGRDRYFVGPHVEVVEETPEAVAAGVDRMIRQNFDKIRIRNHVAHILMFDRHNFITTLNKLVKSIHGVDGMFRSFEPFLGDPVAQRPLDVALGSLAPPDLEEQ